MSVISKTRAWQADRQDDYYNPLAHVHWGLMINPIGLLFVNERVLHRVVAVEERDKS